MLGNIHMKLIKKNRNVLKYYFIFKYVQFILIKNKK